MKKLKSIEGTHVGAQSICTSDNPVCVTNSPNVIVIIDEKEVDDGCRVFIKLNKQRSHSNGHWFPFSVLS